MPGIFARSVGNVGAAECSPRKTSTVSVLYLSQWYEDVDGQHVSEQYYSTDPTMIFSGIIAYATDVSELSFILPHGINIYYKLSSWDLEVLSAGITSLGGQWQTALTRDVTHLFALHEQSDKVLDLFASFISLMLMEQTMLTVVSNCNAFRPRYPHVHPHTALV